MEFRTSPGQRLAVTSGGETRHVMHMLRDVVHMDLRITSRKRGSWGRAQARVQWGQQQVAAMAVYEDPAMNVVPPMVVPCHEPITVHVHAPGFEPVSRTTTLSLDDPIVRFELEPR